jgi:hypothetical protein
MTPLAPVPHDAHLAFLQRARLMSQPDKFYAQVFGGRTPSLHEKLQWIEQSVQHVTSLQAFTNDLYFIRVERRDAFFQVNIQRHDGQPCREWRHLQQIKNELFGPKHEAVELYPAEDRLVDISNEYHLWVHADPSYRFPIGFQNGRRVQDQPADSAGAPGAAMACSGSLDSCAAAAVA